jgi:hypothetical protein
VIMSFITYYMHLKVHGEQNTKMIVSGMAVRTCKVSWRDPQGVEHTVEVSAQSVFEAVAQALRVFASMNGAISLLPPASWCASDSPKSSTGCRYGISTTGLRAPAKARPRWP